MDDREAFSVRKYFVANESAWKASSCRMGLGRLSTLASRIANYFVARAWIVFNNNSA